MKAWGAVCCAAPEKKNNLALKIYFSLEKPWGLHAAGHFYFCPGDIKVTWLR